MSVLCVCQLVSDFFCSPSGQNYVVQLLSKLAFLAGLHAVLWHNTDR